MRSLSNHTCNTMCSINQTFTAAHLKITNAIRGEVERIFHWSNTYCAAIFHFIFFFNLSAPLKVYFLLANYNYDTKKGNKTSDSFPLKYQKYSCFFSFFFLLLKNRLDVYVTYTMIKFFLFLFSLLKMEFDFLYSF